MEQKPRSMMQDVNNSLNTVLLVAFTLSKPLEAVFRVPGSTGARNFANVTGYLSLPGLFVFGALAKSPLTLKFAMLYVGLLFAHRLAIGIAESSGRHVHSYWGGTSWLGYLVGDRAAKGKLEPAVALVAGLFMLGYDRPFGGLLIASSISLAAVWDVQRMRIKSQQRAVRDALIEQEHFSERMGGRYGP